MNETLDVVLDVLAAVCLLGGAVLTLAAGVGLVRFPDLLARMHTATKPQVLGLILMMLGLALRLRSGPVMWMLLLVALFQMLTSPVAAHMVARAGYRTGKVRKELLVVDELTRDLELAHAEVAQAEVAQSAPDRAAQDEADPPARADQDGDGPVS
ncbi:monovalent cation/H(+) antiporter subunit G [Actinotalea sp. BY-33]|uniref:Monovalent cation/H(+) antiporter subunit G n=1 Tax=Actinotalea soli TaxID=2819234 RepID=A0A939RX69_9CELL|nr:monovalent cation/H(+) antiporter subunit G [Actinotalea soli]MBO1752906.1 monovalent cation/H(+) antiporter subunit G [Actinotalea soli]